MSSQEGDLPDPQTSVKQYGDDQSLNNGLDGLSGVMPPESYLDDPKKKKKKKKVSGLSIIGGEHWCDAQQ